MEEQYNGILDSDESEAGQENVSEENGDVDLGEKIPWLNIDESEGTGFQGFVQALGFCITVVVIAYCYFFQRCG